MMNEQYLANLLGALSNGVAMRVEAQLDQHALPSLSAAQAIIVVGNHPDESTDMLRRTLGLTHSGTVRLVSRLEADGLMTRQRSAHDGRAVTLRLTDAGKVKANSLLVARAAETMPLVQGLAPNEQQQLHDLLVKMLSAQTEKLGDARQTCRMCDERCCHEGEGGCPVKAAAEAREMALSAAWPA